MQHGKISKAIAKGLVALDDRIAAAQIPWACTGAIW
jgi:hypothetical protein